MFTAIEFSLISSSSRTGKETGAVESPLLTESPYSTTFKSGKSLARAALVKHSCFQ